jgi:ParB family chromosome partitioning protein
LSECNEVPIASIRTGPEVLRPVDECIVSELADSIQTNGLLQPILVRPTGSTYEIVFGHHRLAACKRLRWQSIPAIVKAMSPEDSFLTKVVENLQRNIQINPLMEAKGYIKLIDNGWTINKIAQRIGKSDSYVSDRIGLVRRLHPEVANKIHDNGDLKPSHGELLARLKSKNEQLRLSELVRQRRLSVRRLEMMISGGEPLKETLKSNGKTFYVNLPQEIVEQSNLRAGDLVYIYVQSRSKRITIESAAPLDRRPSLKELIAAATAQSR